MVKIVCDSTCDLPADIVRNYGISVVPLHIVLDDCEYRDQVDITIEDIFKWCEETKSTPKTSAVSFEDAEAALLPIAENNDEAIIFVISESMSTTGNVFRMVIEDMDREDKMFVFDSQNLTVGIGLLAMEASRMAAEGMNAREILCKLNSLKDKVRTSFVIDTLTYLARGGRCSGAAALAGSMFKIHPKIVVKDGAMDVDKKYRGQLHSVIMDYVHDLESELKSAQKDRMFIVTSGIEENIIADVREYVESLGYFDEILFSYTGGVISSHCGPGTLGIVYIAEED